MFDQPSPVIIPQTVNADPLIAAKEKNYEDLIEKIGYIVKQNHSYFVGLGALISSQITAGDSSPDIKDASFPGFINRAVTLQLNSLDAQLDNCLETFNINNSSLIKSIIKMSRK